MSMEMQQRNGTSSTPVTMESGFDDKHLFDDDDKPKRTGTLLTAISHIITAVIGSGVLSLAWALAQLGWIAGPIALMAISVITLYSSSLLTDCYRSPDPITGRRNYTYMEAVKANLGGSKYKLCGIAQYGFFVAAAIAYTITASTSLAAIKRSNCFHKHGHSHGDECREKSYPFIIVFAVIEIILSQIPNFHKLSLLSIVAAIMSFAYAFIGLGLAAGKIAAGGNEVTTTLTGVRVGVEVGSNSQKLFRVFQAIGNIASAYFYSTVIIEIQA
ncbi:Amino acid permease [Thalictrum thalictroides]|uniref:Amino acid permease n=1 Tax=Thalictrum thalictroides TaxID=46969 RepID=A0A7J6WS07_THATH|nr:Amino acid permease [Thalictrum thalictroides]